MRATLIFFITGLALVHGTGAIAADLATNAATNVTPSPKAWAPPDVIPAQPNWTWTTSDGTTYHNVVVTRIGPETVSISHAMGVAHDIPIAKLPPDIQKQLNYDAVAATAARKETAREAAHPYYNFADRAQAQEVARQLHWPLAWFASWDADLTFPNPPPDSEQDLTQKAMESLKSRAVIIFSGSNDNLGIMSPVVRDQFFTMDDGPMPDGHHFYAPKIVLTDADITVALGRISHKQMLATGTGAIDEAFTALTKTPHALASTPALTNAAPPVAPATSAPVPKPAPSVTPPPVPSPAWTPPAVLPAQPNWTWTTSDGTTYENVVVKEIGPKTVSITHSKGVAHDIPIANLPPDVQKQLNYIPKTR